MDFRIIALTTVLALGWLWSAPPVENKSVELTFEHGYAVYD